MKQVNPKILDFMKYLNVKYSNDPSEFLPIRTQIAITQEIACYEWVSDSICLRIDACDFFGYDPNFVLLHELTHWTGASSRLNRKLKSENMIEYETEELIAHTGAVYLGKYFGYDFQDNLEKLKRIFNFADKTKADFMGLLAAQYCIAQFEKKQKEMVA
jgi:antirestriction protein ArdC